MAIKRGGRELSAREQKDLVMWYTGWSSKQYQKEYDKLRNRARNYERITGDISEGRIDVSDLLARKAREDYYARVQGRAPQYSFLYRSVMNAPSTSTGQKISSRRSDQVNDSAVDLALKKYHGLFTNSKYAGEIQRDLDQIRAQRKLTVYDVKAIAKVYGDLLQAERDLIKGFNAVSPDPFYYIEPGS